MLIQKLRLQRGWSQEQLAELSGLSTRTIQRIERGQQASVESLKALAAVFEIELAQLQPQPEASMNPSMDPLQHPSTAAAGTPSPGVRPDEALAFHQVRRIQRFYFNVVRYLVVIAGLTALNLYEQPHHLWVIWVAVPWGLVLLMRGIALHGRLPFLGAEWERREVERRLGRPL